MTATFGHQDRDGVLAPEPGPAPSSPDNMSWMGILGGGRTRCDGSDWFMMLLSDMCTDDVARGADVTVDACIYDGADESYT